MNSSSQFSIKCILLLIVFAIIAKSRIQNVTVTGVLVCEKIKLHLGRIELWEKDLLGPDDYFGSVTMTVEGDFTFFLEEDEITTISPYLVVYHRCMVKKEGCQRITKFVIPQQKIGGVYNMSYISLDMYQPFEKMECVEVPSTTVAPSNETKALPSNTPV